MEHSINHSKNEKPMYQPDFGNSHLGILGICGTVLLYGTSLLTINDGTLATIHAIASISTTIAALSTAIYYLKKSFFNKKKL
jgi:hypothetical protein